MFDPLRNVPRSQNTRRLGSTETIARIFAEKFGHENCVRGTVGSRRNPADPTYCFTRSRRAATTWILVRRAAPTERHVKNPFGVTPQHGIHARYVTNR